ncbi:ZCP1 [Auxenochlorella protothecoides x Auxenochlorella symbiontica]
MQDTRTPVTIITGFLGSGKTTLINHILTSDHGKKICIIENEFGEVNIDNALVIDTIEEIFEMNNGCICCNIRGDLVRVLDKIRKRKNKFDAIFIETTGLADPAPVAHTFFMDDGMKESFRVDAIVTMVDCKHVMLAINDDRPVGCLNEAERQLAFADKLILNKVDLATKEEKKEVLACIKGVNPGVEILECEYAKVDVEKILDARAFEFGKTLTAELEARDAAGSGSDEEDHVHDTRVSSVGIVLDGELDTEKFQEWLSKLLSEHGPDIFRSKGILAMHGTNEKLVFHGVHSILQFGSSTEGNVKAWEEDEPRVCRAVFIGKNLDREALDKGFRSCLAVVKPRSKEPKSKEPEA